MHTFASMLADDAFLSDRNDGESYLMTEGSSKKDTGDLIDEGTRQTT